MASTRALVKRRKAIRNIRKITRTMELIATARFKKAMDRATQARAYTDKIAELAGDLSAAASGAPHPLLAKREVKTTLLLVVTSNRGLCGGYNAGILREASGALRAVRDAGQTLQLEVSGRRGIAWFRYQGQKAAQTYTQFEDKPTFDEVRAVADRYLAAYVAGEVDRVQVAYMKFFSAGRQAPVVETLLPLEPPPRAAGQEEKEVEYEFLPGARDILEELLPESFRVRLFQCFLDAAVSEQIARRVTMKAATENADDMIKSITQHYNRVRQAQITKEIAEVIGGAAALE
jgi:F-type H+-transporting ATPase subunit gamma